MSELRWILIVVGLLILAAVFLFSRYRDVFRLPSAREVLIRKTPSLGTDAASGEAQDALKKESAPRDSRVITIRLMARHSEEFQGKELILALRKEGLRHGRFGIFHSCLSEEDEQTLFSAASLTEPGSFDLSRLDEDTYQGISLFMVVPGLLQGAEIFDRMMKVGRNLSKTLDGELLDENGSAMSVQRERFLREEILDFERRLSRPE